MGGHLRIPIPIYHAIKTTGDRNSKGHLSEFTNPKINPEDPLQNFQPAPQFCQIQGCYNRSEVGAHVYLDNEMNSPWERVLIIPTCKFHNNYRGNEERGQNWDGTGPKATAQWVKV